MLIMRYGPDEILRCTQDDRGGRITMRNSDETAGGEEKADRQEYLSHQLAVIAASRDRKRAVHGALYRDAQ
jgi:hypothetical protein